MWYNRQINDLMQGDDWNISHDTIFTRMFYNVPEYTTFTKVEGTWNSEETFI